MLNLTHVKQPVVAAAALFATITLPVQADSPTASQPKTNGTSEPEPYRVPNEHVAMREAVRKARTTVQKFIHALKHPASGETDFEVKKPYTIRAHYNELTPEQKKAFDRSADFRLE
jgi:hypothetical protein